MLKIEPYLQNARHVIWDWNGTLLSDLDHTIATVNSFLKERKLTEMTVDSYRKVFGFPIRRYYQDIGFNLTNESFEDLCHQFVDLYMKGVFSCDLFPDAREFLTRVKQSGKIQSVLSASDQDSLNRMMDYYDLRSVLDYTYGIADKMAASKVSRGEELIATSGIDPQDTILLGDTDHDLEVGEALGVKVILLARGHQCAEKLKKLHHTVIEF